MHEPSTCMLGREVGANSSHSSGCVWKHRNRSSHSSGCARTRRNRLKNPVGLGGPTYTRAAASTLHVCVWPRFASGHTTLRRRMYLTTGTPPVSSGTYQRRDTNGRTCHATTRGQNGEKPCRPTTQHLSIKVSHRLRASPHTFEHHQTTRSISPNPAAHLP